MRHHPTGPIRTDHLIYLFLSTGAEALRVLTGGLTLSGPYRFTSVTLKSLERRIDGLFEPEGHAGPAHLVEFYGQAVPGSWYNLLAKLGLYGERDPDRDVLGVATFLRRRHMLEFWFFERFRGRPAKEVWRMLNLVTPIQETVAWQSIFAEGKAEGVAEGTAKGKAEGKAEGLSRLLTRRFGPLPTWATARIAAAPITQLDAWLDGLLDAATLVELLGPPNDG